MNYKLNHARTRILHVFPASHIRETEICNTRKTEHFLYIDLVYIILNRLYVYNYVCTY